MDPQAYESMAKIEDEHWWFVARRKIIEQQMRIISGRSRSLNILEVGAGTGGNLKMLSSFGKVTGLEMDAGARDWALTKAGSGIEVLLGRCPEEMPFIEGGFDVICFFDVLEHIEHDADVLVKLRGFIAEGGSLLLTVPAYRWLWGAHDVFLHHKRRYTRASLASQLSKAGFRVRRLTYFNFFLFPLVIVARMIDRFSGKYVSGQKMPHSLVNKIMEGIFSSEVPILRKIDFPVGVSLLAWAVQENSDSGPEQ